MGTKDSKPRVQFPSYRGRYYVRENRGVAVASKWPRTRPSPRNPKSEFWSSWLQQANVLYYAMPEFFRKEIRKAGKGQPQFPRDIAIASMRGTLWSYDSDEGQRRYPMQAATKVSESLDVLAQVPGMMLLRGPQIWVPVPPGSASGQVLTYDEPNASASWQDAAGGGFYTPPMVGDFPTGINTTGVTFVQAPTTPAVLHRPSPAGSNKLNAFVKSLPTPTKIYIVGMTTAGSTSTDVGPNVVIGDSGTGELVAYSFNKTTLAGTLEVMVEHWNSPTSFASQVAARTILHTGPMFFRLTDDGTDLTFDYSAEAAGWINLHTESRTAFLTTPDQVGLGFRNRGFDVSESMAAYIHWAQS